MWCFCEQCFFPLLSIMKRYKLTGHTDNKCSIFFTFHCTVPASFLHSLVIQQMPSMIINWFKLFLPVRCSRHWYCPFPALMVLNEVFCDNSLVIKERKFVKMLHVINEITIDTCNIHQIKEVKSNRWLSIQTICGMVHKINSTHVAVVKFDRLKRRSQIGLWTLFSPLKW